MADDKKNTPDAGKVDKPPKPGKVESVKADSPVQDQPAPAKTETLVVEGAPEVQTSDFGKSRLPGVPQTSHNRRSGRQAAGVRPPLPAVRRPPRAE